MIFSSFMRNPIGFSYDGGDEDEQIYFVLRRSFILNIPWMVLLVVMILLPSLIGPYFTFFDDLKVDSKLGFVLGCFWYLLCFGFAFQNFLNWFFNVYIITDKKIVDVDFHGLLYKNISEAPIKSIEDVTSNISGTVGVIFNVGDVYIQTAAEQREFEFTGLNNPSRIRDLVADLVEKTKKHEHR